MSCTNTQVSCSLFGIDNVGGAKIARLYLWGLRFVNASLLSLTGATSGGHGLGGSGRGRGRPASGPSFSRLPELLRAV